MGKTKMTKTPRAGETELAELKGLLDDAAGGLPMVHGRKMFGCHALFAGDGVFALVWKTGRIGVRLPDRGRFDELMAKPGAAPWTAGDRTMSHWVLVPESFHKKRPALVEWVSIAHGLAAASEPAAAKAKPARKPQGASKLRT